MPDTTVRYYASTMTGAPTLSGTAGALIGVLDACLVNGFGSVTLTSLVVASNVATATVSGGHNFANYGNTLLGPVITIAGATPSGLNGEWRINVTSSTQFTFATTGISDQTATGTITAKRSPAGFAKTYSGTNKAVYRANAVSSTRLYLRVNDAPTQYPELRMYEAMSDVDTGTGATDIRYTYKSSTENSTARAWTLIANDRCFYLINDYDTVYAQSGFQFGDIISYLPGDAYHCVINANYNSPSYASRLCEVNNYVDRFLSRSYTQIGGAVFFIQKAFNQSSYIGYVGQATFPSVVGNHVHLSPVEIMEGSTDNTGPLRGRQPGLYSPFFGYATLNSGTIVNNVIIDGTPRVIIIVALYNGRLAFDITGPWQ